MVCYYIISGGYPNEMVHTKGMFPTLKNRGPWFITAERFSSMML